MNSKPNFVRIEDSPFCPLPKFIRSFETYTLVGPKIKMKIKVKMETKMKMELKKH